MSVGWKTLGTQNNSLISTYRKTKAWTTVKETSGLTDTYVRPKQFIHWSNFVTRRRIQEPSN